MKNVDTHTMILRSKKHEKVILSCVVILAIRITFSRGYVDLLQLNVPIPACEYGGKTIHDFFAI